MNCSFLLLFFFICTTYFLILQFNEVNEGETASLSDSLSSSFHSDAEKLAYEEHLAQIQDQLVSAMIENQNLGLLKI